jgi:hypothetical protein
MDQLIAFVTQKTGLPQDQATQAAQAAIDFLKGKLPGPIASQIDGVLGGGGAGGAAGGLMDQAKGMLGGMMGGGGSGQQWAHSPRPHRKRGPSRL